MTNTPDPILVSVGAGVSYPKLDLVPLPAASTGSEAVTLNSTAPAGLTLKFNPSTVTLSTANKVSVALVVNSTQSLAPGDYKISVVAHYGSTSTKSDITIRVVQYLVFQTTNSFSPSSITVKSGTTVYWINLDSPVGGDPEVHNVVFSFLDEPVRLIQLHVHGSWGVRVHVHFPPRNEGDRHCDRVAASCAIPARERVGILSLSPTLTLLSPRKAV
jgi:plastocyanin